MNFVLNISAFLLCFIGMEFVAWCTHKYLMHGTLWFLHRDHHQKDQERFFERNDFFFLIFATPGIALLWLGTMPGKEIFSWMGAGITAYGLAYFLVHEIFIHRRFNLFQNSNSAYLRAVRKAHKVHHKHLNRENGESFGMLWVSRKYFLEAKKAQNA